MDVPLAAFRTIVNERQYIDVWTSEGVKRVPTPFRPYCYTREPLDAATELTERVEVRPLSTLETTTWFRHEFANVRGVSEVSREERPLGMADNHVAFVERVLIDEPDFFRAFPHGREPRLMVVDIEQLTTGDGFPTEREPLIAIAWAVGDDEPTCVLGDGKSDRDILNAFLDAVQAADPDVYVGYNITGYDLPMILKRLQANGIDASRLGRGDRSPYARDDEILLEGRLVYDVFNSVKLDQTLHGIKDRSLKTVGEWMKFDVVKEDMKDTRALVGTERLATYNKSDVVLTRNLGRIYWKNFIALAEMYGAPLNVVLRATPIFHTNVLQGRVFQRAEPRIISDGTNEQRYAALYQEAGGQAFIGGFVEIYQKGLFEPLWKIDFSSMYPSIMVSLGCGADNTRFVGMEPLGPFTVRVDDGERIYSIPDDSRAKNLLVGIRGVSPLALQLKELMQLRMTLKRQAKATLDDDERDRLIARQNVIKVVLNSIYGNMASGFARYGSLPVAVATVGVARHLIGVVENVLGDAKIETDTDGVYTAKPVELEKVNAAVEAFVAGELGGENFMRLDVDEYVAGYFHKAKSYLLLHKDGRIEKHGIAFKGSSLCGVFDKTLESVSEALLMGKGDPREVGRAAFDMDAYTTPDDFIMRVRMGKSLAEYSAPNAVGAQVARKYIERHGREPKRGEQLEYLKTKDGYDLVTPEAIARIDHEYYKGIVQNVLERLDIDWRPHRQVSLFEF